MQVWGRFWVTRNGNNLIGRGRVTLLKKIAETGSISQAAKSMKMSYKAAWDAVDAMGKTLGEPLVTTSTGGRGGGGAQLTTKAHRIIAAFDAMELSHQQILQNLAAAFNAALDQP